MIREGEISCEKVSQKISGLAESRESKSMVSQTYLFDIAILFKTCRARHFLPIVRLKYVKELSQVNSRSGLTVRKIWTASSMYSSARSGTLPLRTIRPRRLMHGHRLIGHYGQSAG